MGTGTPAAYPNLEVYWTGEAGDGNFQTYSNWRYKSDDTVLESLHYPGDGSTIDSSVNVLATLSNRPTTGTYHFECKRDSSFIDAYFIDVSTVAVGDVELSDGTFGFSGYCMGAITFTGPARLAIVGPTAIIGSGTGLVGSSGGTIGSASTDAALEAQEGITGDTFTIDWGNGELDIWGTINATNVTHTNIGTENLLTPFLGGTLKLGGSAAGLAIDIDADGYTVTTGAAIACGQFLLTAGILAGSHTLDSNGGIILTGGTNSHTGAWTMSGNGYLSASGYALNIVSLTILSGVTAVCSSANVWLAKLAGAGILNVNGKLIRLAYHSASNFWTFTGTVTGTGTVYMVGNSGVWSWTNGAINLGNVTFTNQYFPGYSGTLTLSGRLTCGNLDWSSKDAGQALTLTCNGGLTANVVTLGVPSVTTAAGVIVLGNTGHTIGSLAIGTGNTGANALHLAGSTHLTGTLDGDNIAITAAAGNKITGGTLTNVDAVATETIRAYRAVGVDDASNVNVKFRKRLGSGSGGGLAGWHRVA